MNTRLALSPAFVMIMLCLVAPCSADDALLWQVGKCDNSYAEFGLAGHYENYKRDFGSGGTFEIGKGDPAKNWVYFHPGPSHAAAGDGEHPFEILFELDREPSGPMMLRVDVVDASPQPATLRVRVNEHTRFFPLKAGASEGSLRDPAAGREQVVETCVSAGNLRKGRNVVNLVVDEGAWVLYDCVSLRRIPKAPHLAEGLILKPTCLYKTHDGELKQVMRASLELYEDQRLVHTILTGESGWRAEKDFSDLRSGVRILDVEAPVVSKPERVRLTAKVGDEVHEAEATIYPQKRWNIYLMPATHFDHGYNMLQDEARKLARENNDRALEWCAKYPGLVWNNESSFLAEDYLANGAHKDEFIARMKSGEIGVMGFYTNFLTGICSGEELTRHVDYYDYLRRTYGVESKCATQNDNPTMVATIPMVLAGHGIKYLSHGMNPTRARGDQEPCQYPFYWESPDGSRVLMWKISGTYAQSAEITGLEDAGHMGLAYDRVTSLVREFEERKDYPFDAILLHGAYGDNWPNGESIAKVPYEWNRTYAYPKIIFCRGAEFFEHIEKNFAKHIKTLKGDGGVYWEDGANSSARESAVTRTAKEDLATAEKLISLCGPGFRKRMSAELKEAWRNVFLYDEHTWGADVSISHPDAPQTVKQWAVKSGFADKAAEQSSTILARTMEEFCRGVKAAQDSIVVFNPSSWQRGEWVRAGSADGKAIAVFADQVPPLGYKVIPISSAKQDDLREADGDTLENDHYVVRFDKSTGAVASIFDKDLKRELVDSSSYGLGAYLYVTGGDGSGKAILGEGGTEPTVLTVNTCSGPAFQKLTGQDREVMRIRLKAPNCKGVADVEVTLRSDVKRIDFRTEMDKIESLKKEGGYFAFPFAFTNPEIRLEIPNGVIRAEVDQFKASCRDWYCAQHFVTVSDGSAAVAWTALDSPLLTLQDINRGQWYDHIKIENGNVFAYVFSNYWWTNYKASQEGPHTFRFSMTSARAIDDAAAKRFGESVQSQMPCRMIKGSSSAKQDKQSHSFVQVSEPNVVVQSVMPARFDDGTIVRLREMGGKTTDAGLKVDGISFRRAWLCNLAEDKLGELKPSGGAIAVPCKRLGLATVLLER